MSVTTDKGPSHLRAAETSDIPRMSSVIIAAMELSPHWTWRHAYRKQYPDVHQRETERLIADYVKKSKDGICVAMVAEMDVEVETEGGTQPSKPTTEELLLGGGPGPGKGSTKKTKQWKKEIVGIAIAQLPGTFMEPMTRVIRQTPPEVKDVATGNTGNAPRPPRADMHTERSKAFGAEFGPAKKRYFDVPYGNNQLYIDFMAVHPEYHRRGIAMQLLRWMLDLAQREKDAEVVTLFSSPMGEGLYKKAGFEQIVSLTVKLENDTEEGGAEGITAGVLVWNRDKHFPRAELPSYTKPLPELP